MAPNADERTSGYDLLLASVPLLLVAGVALAVALTERDRVYLGLAAGSALASVAVAYGLFANPPTPG